VPRPAILYERQVVTLIRSPSLPPLVGARARPRVTSEIPWALLSDPFGSLPCREVILSPPWRPYFRFASFAKNWPSWYHFDGPAATDLMTLSGQVLLDARSNRADAPGGRLFSGSTTPSLPP
jgi:hypothetical protein